MATTASSPWFHCCAACASDDIELGKRRAGSDPLIAKTRHVDGAVFAMHDVLGNGLPDRRRLLQAMAGKAVGEIEIAQARVRADDRVLVEVVVVVVPDPGIGRLYRLESRHAHGKTRPDLVFEPAMVDLEIELPRLVALFRRQAGDELPALRPDVKPARIDGERRLVQRFRGIAAVEHEDVALARPDGERNAGQPGDPAGGGPG